MTGEAFDVLGQVGGDIVRIAFELFEGEAAGIVEGLPGYLVEDRLQVLDPAALQLLEPGQDLVLGGFEHAVQPAQDGHGQHDVLVLVGTVGPAQ